ncbi:MAG: peptidoglycan DD-metalloendopeptidase family protein [Yoonia sp.]|nr:peptidoglycan DD-metalloendopeptidase family protein [Yoonia sp.]
MIRLILILMLATTSATAQSTGEAAIAAAERLAMAGESLTAAGSARDRVKALTETVQAYEDGLVAMRAGLRRAAIRQKTVEAELAAKSGEVGRLLGVLQTMGRAPTPLLLLHPSGPTGTARGGMMVADVAPAIQDEVMVLRAQLEEVALLRGLQENAAATLQEGLDGAQAARTALSAAISDRTDLPQRFTEDPIQTALLLASTETLEGFASGLTEAFIDGVTPVDAMARKGTLQMPVQGQLLRAFNAPDAAGISRPGVIVAARPRALVTAPAAATILFRGPLLEYGNVIILEPAADVLFVIAGLADVFGETGQVIPEGSPIGLLGGEVPSANAILTESGANSGSVASQTLYLEVREGQSPINPADWFVLDAN